ncbi:MAG: hypothetical protein IRY99_18845, partial [Isosphaeraceae bacterium]|nr:hypothetical protein [Isosphaeraceae bacterium]
MPSALGASPVGPKERFVLTASDLIDSSVPMDEGTRVALNDERILKWMLKARELAKTNAFNSVVVRIPSGNYLFSRPIILPYDRIVLEGAGRDATRLYTLGHTTLLVGHQYHDDNPLPDSVFIDLYGRLDTSVAGGPSDLSNAEGYWGFRCGNGVRLCAFSGPLVYGYPAYGQHLVVELALDFDLVPPQPTSVQTPWPICGLVNSWYDDKASPWSINWWGGDLYLNLRLDGPHPDMPHNPYVNQMLLVVVSRSDLPTSGVCRLVWQVDLAAGTVMVGVNKNGGTQIVRVDPYINPTLTPGSRMPLSPNTYFAPFQVGGAGSRVG